MLEFKVYEIESDPVRSSAFPGKMDCKQIMVQ